MDQNEEGCGDEKDPEDYLSPQTVGNGKQIIISWQLANRNVPHVLEGAADWGVPDVVRLVGFLIDLDLPDQVEGNHEGELNDKEHEHEEANVPADLHDDEN